MSVPRLRFHEFFQDWMCGSLSDIANINPKPGKMPQEFYYIDLESVVSGELTKNSIISSENAPSRAQRILVVGDVLFQTVRPYQKNNYLFKEEKEHPSVASTGYAQLRTGLNGSFLYQLLHTERFGYEVNIRCTGSSYPAINSSDLGEIAINYPCIEEQHVIADLFELLDQKIKLQRRKVELLKDYKKGLLRDTFSRIVFFEDENVKNSVGKKICLEKCYSKGKAGGTPVTINKEYYTDAGVPFLSINDMTEQGKYIRYTKKHITELGLENSSAWRVPSGSLILSMYASVGFVSINTIELATSQAMFSMVFDDGDTRDYVYYYLQFFKNTQIHRWIEVGTQGNINADMIRRMPIYLPTKDEQNKISELLSRMDDDVEENRKLLNGLVGLKAGLLSKMFI